MSLASYARALVKQKTTAMRCCFHYSDQVSPDPGYGLISFIVCDINPSLGKESLGLEV